MTPTVLVELRHGRYFCALGRLFPGSDGRNARGAESTIHPNTGMPKRRTSASSSRRRNGNDGAMNRWSCICDGS
jgi:hypothetical protein